MHVRSLVSVVAVGALAGALALASPAQAVPDPVPPPAVGAMPTEIPSRNTPGVTVGTKVTSIIEVGTKVFAAGPFTEVGGQARAGVAAFDRVTGTLDTTFNPAIVGQVYALSPGPTPDTIYVAGIVRSVDGLQRSKVALLRTTTGALVTSFKPPSINGMINDLKFRNGVLYLGGYFTQVGGAPRGGLASLDPTTGALTDALRVDVTEHHNTDPTRMQRQVGVLGLDVTKDGRRLVVIGNFRKANGLDRDQIVQVNLTGTSSSIDAWQTNRFKPLCGNLKEDSYLKGMSLSPDDSYFVIGAGGASVEGMCDTVSKWQTFNAVSDAQPEWISASGGDTMWAVAVSDHAIYVGGHQRWMNNPLGRNRAAAGAVPRSGIAALDPINGMPMTWNPGRVPRGVSVFAILAGTGGVWIGSDTDYISINPAYKRQKLAYFPYAGGYTATPATLPTLPGTVYVGRGDLGGGTTVTSSWTYDGTRTGAQSNATSAIDWSQVRGAFTVGDKLYLGTPGTLKVASFDGKTVGTPRIVEPYHDPKWMNWPDGRGGTYDGVTPPFYGQLASVTGMFYDRGRLFYTTGGSTLYSVPFSPDSGVVGPIATAVSSPLSFSGFGDMFVAGSRLYLTVPRTGDLWSVGWTGTTTTGTMSRISGPSLGGPSWAGRAVFLGNPSVAGAPTAAFTSSCVGLTCTFDASASTDPDGAISRAAWSFGDGATGSGMRVTRTYAAAGQQSVTLSVTDDSGTTASTSSSAEPVATPAGSGFVAQVGTTDNYSTVKSMTVPDQVRPGDTLVLHWVGDQESSPTGVTSGWTMLRSVAHGTSLATVVWTKEATSADVGSEVTITQPVGRRTTAQLLAYRGYAGVKAVAHDSDSRTAVHVTPSLDVSTGDYVVGLFADRSTGTTSWTPASGQVARGDVLGTSTTRYSTFAADRGAPRSGGTDPGLRATVNEASLKGIGITLALRP